MNIENYKPNDEAAIIALFDHAFGKPMAPSYWKWRFLDNPRKITSIKLMWHEEQLVGHYAVSPVMLDINDEPVLTGLSMTTMTHPAFAGLGIFQQLSEALYKEMQGEQGMAAVWGFPNVNSHRGFIKNLDWKDIALLPMLSCTTSGIAPKTAANIRKITAFTEMHEQAHAAIFADCPVKVRKDKEYLTWRYFLNPVNKYIVYDINDGADGFVVVKQFSVPGGAQLDIIDWCVAKDERLTKSVLQHLAAEFPAEKFNQFNIWMPLKDERHLFFEKIGFNNALPLTYFGIRSFAMPGLDIDRNWWIQLGDSDVY
ncbi:GNAT family N-acetyltransferase [Chitinophaga sp. YIM B06452]|uniref:GNAT family N-acetyltransferase n=1 Tax=Chitinophaga sp. YIM B06452 TaxID=3082158 RepID=UPI0031FF2324